MNSHTCFFPILSKGVYVMLMKALQRLFRSFGRKVRKVGTPRRFRPQVEGMEERVVPTGAIQYEWIGGTAGKVNDYGTATNWNWWNGTNWTGSSTLPTSTDSIQFDSNATADCKLGIGEQVSQLIATSGFSWKLNLNGDVLKVVSTGTIGTNTIGFWDGGTLWDGAGGGALEMGSTITNGDTFTIGENPLKWDATSTSTFGSSMTVDIGAGLTVKPSANSTWYVAADLYVGSTLVGSGTGGQLDFNSKSITDDEINGANLTIGSAGKVWTQGQNIAVPSGQTMGTLDDQGRFDVSASQNTTVGMKFLVDGAAGGLLSLQNTSDLILPNSWTDGGTGLAVSLEENSANAVVSMDSSSEIDNSGANSGWVEVNTGTFQTLAGAATIAHDFYFGGGTLYVEKTDVDEGGVLTVGREFDMYGGTLKLDVSSTGTSDRVAVGDVATFSGGGITVTAHGTLADPQTFTFFTATGGFVKATGGSYPTLPMDWAWPTTFNGTAIFS